MAPLAEIESSRVAENSPAVEIPPINFSFRLNSNQPQRRSLLLTNSLWRNSLLTTNQKSTLIIPDINENIRLDYSDLNELEKNNNNIIMLNNQS